MNKKRLIIILTLAIFITGICITSVNAAHTIKVGKYKVKISDNKYNQLKKVYHNKANTNFQSYYIKTKYYKKLKVPIYKTKKVTTHKWKYKNVLSGKTVYKTKNSDFTEYEYSTKKYDKWKWYGYFDKSKEYSWGFITKHYRKYKKKIVTYTTKKVKTGKYKTIKKPIYMGITADNSKYAVAFVYYVGTDGEDKYIGKEKKLKL